MWLCRTGNQNATCLAVKVAKGLRCQRRVDVNLLAEHVPVVLDGLLQPREKEAAVGPGDAVLVKEVLGIVAAWEYRRRGGQGARSVSGLAALKLGRGSPSDAHAPRRDEDAASQAGAVGVVAKVVGDERTARRKAGGDDPRAWKALPW